MATVSSQKVKLLCSFGGKILPRPSDNKLRYAGGDTRIISLRRSATISDFFGKIAQICNGDITAVKFQLPGEDLDSLISISCQEDLDNLLEEFDRFNDVSVDGSARIRVFVFEKSEGEGSDLNSETSDASSIYYEAVNGVGIRRKNSVVSNISSNLSNDEYPSKSDIGCSVDENLWLAGRRMNVQGVSGEKVNNFSPKVESFDMNNMNNNVNDNASNNFVYNSSINKGVYPPPLTQLPPLYPMPYTAYYVPPPNHFQQQTIKLNDCIVCQKALPHAHSDTSINRPLNVKVACNGDNDGSGMIIEPRSVLLSCQSEDPMRLQAFIRPDTEYGRAVINSNGESSCYAQASHVPVILNSTGLLTQQQENNESMTKSKPSVMNTCIAQVQLQGNNENMTKSEASMTKSKPSVMNTCIAQAQLQGNNENMAKGEAPVATNVIKPQAKTHANNGKFESSELVQALDASSAINASRQPTQLQVNAGTVETLEHAQTALNMTRHQAQIQGSNVKKETLEHTQSRQVPVAMSTNKPPAQDQINNRTVVSSEHAEASHVPIVVCTTKPLAPIEANNGMTETTEVHASIAVNENRSQALVPTNNGPVEVLLERAQVSHVPIARNMTRPQVPIQVNNGAVENLEHVQDLPAPIATNTPRQQAQAQIKTEGMTESKLKADEIQIGNPCDVCRYTQDIAHMPKTQIQMKDQSAPSMAHSHVSDPFQTLSQNMVSSLTYMVNQDVATTSVQNRVFQVTESPNRVYVPEISHSYVRPTNSAIQGVHASTFEAPIVAELPKIFSVANNRVVPMLNPEDFSSITENGCAVFHATPVNHLLPYPLELKPEYSTMVMDPRQVARSQAGGISLNPENNSSYIILNGNYYRKIDHMPPPSTDVTHLRSLQPFGTNHGSTMLANHEPLISVSQNLRAQPEASCTNATPVYPSANGMPMQVNGNDPIQYSNAVPIPLFGNAPIQHSHGHGMNGHSELFNRPTPSNPLAYTLDPHKNMNSTHMVPPVLNKVPSREFVPSLDLYTENHMDNNMDCNAAGHVEDCGSQLVQNSKKPVQFIQGENHNIQVQTITEQVTRVHEPPLPPAPMNLLHDGTEPKLSLAEESLSVDASTQTQNSTAVVDDHTIVGIPKQVDKLNAGFPVTDNLGRLQIIKNNDLEELRELGSGTYGTVYHGKWKGTDVAIKRINERCFVGQPSEEECMKSECWNEARNLADLHHPNIVAFYGVVLDGPDGSFATVTEFMVNGSLKRALLKNEKILDQRKRLLIAMDVAFGMEYLHSKNMIHFDLKSDNLLVNLRDPQRPICKIADLGLSKVKRQTLISGGMRGTLPWMAPELLNGNSSLVSNKVDVFSFGIVMWELLTGLEPYHDMHYGAVLGGIVSNNLRPQVPESCDPEWRSLMEQCWSQEPSERPTFVEISSRLRSMAISLPQK